MTDNQHFVSVHCPYISIYATGRHLVELNSLFSSAVYSGEMFYSAECQLYL
jgi:hypothetical protein